MESSTRNKGIYFYLYLFLFSVYFMSAPGNNINSAEHQLARFEQTRSILEEGSLSIPDGTGVKGNYHKDYSWYGLGQPILAMPFYVIGKGLGGIRGAQVMVSLLNQFVTAASGLVLFLFIVNLGYTKKTALTVTAFYALGTLAWPQAKQPFDHPVEMLFVLIAVYYVHRYAVDGRMRYLVASSASLGFAFITRAPAVLAMLPIFVYLYYGRHPEEGADEKRVSAVFKDWAVYSLVFLPFGLIQLWYNFARFGSIFETGMTLFAQHAGIDLFSGTPLFTGLRGFLISPGKGFFFYSPIAVLVFFSIKGFYKRQKGLTFCIAGIALLYMIFLSKNLYWHGDWAWGPRYLLVITPLLMLPIADLVQNKLFGENRFLRYGIIGLFLISIVVQIIGISVDYQRYFISLQEEGVKFTLVGGNDVPVIFEPPPATQFEWDKFPIAYQVSYDWKILKSAKGTLFGDGPKKSPEAQQKKMRPLIFDFWWYAGAYSGFSLSAILLMLSLLGFIIAFSAFKAVTMAKA